MRQIILFATLLTSFSTFSQNAIAELKFEEAETAFNNGNYELTIQKADEFEEALGGMTDKSLYLRIVSQNKLFDSSIFYTDKKQFTLYTTLLDNAAKYIKATENNGLNDKFKEVYTINENLKKLGLPKDETAWEKEKLRIEKEEHDKQNIKLSQLEQCKKTYEELTLYNLPFGITIKDFKKQYPNILGENSKKIELNGKYTADNYVPKNATWNKEYGWIFDNFDEANQNIIVYTNKHSDKIVGYDKQIFFYKSTVDKSSEYDRIKKDLLSKYRHLSNCTAPLEDTDKVFSVRNGNKTLVLANDVTQCNDGSKIYSIMIRVWFFE